LDNRAQNKVTYHDPSTIEIESCQDRFERVHQQRCLVASAALFLTASQSQILADLKPLRDTVQVPLSNEMRAQLRQLSFVKSGKAVKQSLATHEPQHGIAQKLEHFVVATNA